MEHLITQLPQCRYLRRLHIENVMLNKTPLKQKTQEQIDLGNTEMSIGSSRMQTEGSKFSFSLSHVNPLYSIGAHIISGIRNWESNNSLQQMTLKNCLASGDMCSFLSNAIMLLT